MKIMEEKERVKKSKEDAKRERGGVSRKKKTSVNSFSGIVQPVKFGFFIAMEKICFDFGRERYIFI